MSKNPLDGLNSKSKHQASKNNLGPLHNESKASLNETDAVPHNLTKFSEMNNSIQVIKAADLIHSGEEHYVLDEQENKDEEPSFPLMDILKQGEHNVVDATSAISSLNQSLLNNQPSNAISQSFADLEQEEEEELTSYGHEDDLLRGGGNGVDECGDGVKEAIVDLYLAIKIRSTEELDQINESNLKNEKKKLLRTCDCFQILEYIRSSIEIIMNLKIEDLEKNDQKKTPQSFHNLHSSRLGQDTEMSLTNISVASKNLILQSMKDALIYMIENKETADNADYVAGDSSSKN